MPRRAFSSCSLLILCLAFATPARAASQLAIPQMTIAVAGDSDGDGLSDESEGLLGTDAVRADTDADGITDGDEVHVFQTDPRVADTDADGFKDGAEIAGGFSPLAKGKSLAQVDTDGDGLSDKLEIAFNANPSRPDTDGDGWGDNQEVQNGFDPRDPSPTRLAKTIIIHTKSEKLAYALGGVQLGEFTVSTGKRSTPTPTGTFQIAEKHPRAWSRRAGLWMPWWNNIVGKGAPRGMYGIHELPEWPGGRKEGANHLGTPVSGGCIRLGIGPAKFVYDWAPVGTPVTIMAD